MVRTIANPYHHAVSSTRKWGGKPEDYQPIHDWFDATKAHQPDFRHRALRHHAEGIFLCEQVFGHTIVTSTGRVIPVRWIGEQHVHEDMGWIPTAADWLRRIEPEPWMTRGAKPLSRILDREPDPIDRSVLDAMADRDFATNREVTP